MELWRLQSNPITLKREIHQIVCDRFFNQGRTTEQIDIMRSVDLPGVQVREIIWSLADLEKRTGLKLVKTSGYKYCCLSFSDLMAKGEIGPRTQNNR